MNGRPVRSFTMAAVFAALAACTAEPSVANDDSVSSHGMAGAHDTSSPVSGNYAAFAALLERRQIMAQRVSTISRRLRVANAPLCDLTRPDAGLSSHELEDYPPRIRPLAMHFMDMEAEGRFVRAVVPGSPADRASIEPGDRILSGWPVSDTAPLVTQDGPVALQPDTACIVPTHVIDSDIPNAATDGREIDLSTALIEQLPEDTALAFVIAHEMAHVLRGHTPDGPRWAAELQADGDALTLLRNAGYDVEAAVGGWEAGIEAHRESQSMSGTHPPVELRLRNLQTALARLQAGPEGFSRLPE